MSIYEMEWWHWAILTVPVCMLTFGMSIWFLWLGRKPHFPPGKRARARKGRFRVTVVQNPEVAVQQLQVVAEECVLALWSVDRAWRFFQREAVEDVSHVVVSLLPSAYFDRSPYLDIQKAKAYAVYTGASVGAGLPAVVIRGVPTVLNLLSLKGQPMAHEVIHHYLGQTSEPDKDRDHDAPGVWGGGAVEGYAETLYRGMYDSHMVERGLRAPHPV